MKHNFFRYVLLIEKNKLLSDNMVKRKIVGGIGAQGRMLKVQLKFINNLYDRKKLGQTFNV